MNPRAFVVFGRSIRPRAVIVGDGGMAEWIRRVPAKHQIPVRLRVPPLRKLGCLGDEGYWASMYYLGAWGATAWNKMTVSPEDVIHPRVIVTS